MLLIVYLYRWIRKFNVDLILQTNTKRKWTHQLPYRLEASVYYLSKMPPLGSVSSLTLPITSKPVSFGRLYCITLHCIVLHCIVLYYIVLHCTTLHYIVLQCSVLYHIVLHFIILYCSALYCIVRYCTVLYHIVLCCIVLYFIVDHCYADSLPQHHICIKHENAECRALSGLKLKEDIVYSDFPRKLFGVHDDYYWLGMPTPFWWFAPLYLWKKH